MADVEPRDQRDVVTPYAGFVAVIKVVLQTNGVEVFHYPTNSPVMDCEWIFVSVCTILTRTKILERCVD
jgi:hypothetical protein